MDEIAQVRLLIPDVDTNNQIFTDTQIANYIVLAKGNLFRAGALAIGALSVDEAITYKVIKTDDQSIDGAAVADALRKRAIELENLARRDDSTTDELEFSVHYPQPQILAPELIPVPVNRMGEWEYWRGYC